MIFILLVILIILTGIVYFYYGKDLLTPTIWMLFGYLASVLLAITQFSVWGDLSLKTVMTISIALIAFIIGGMFASKVIFRKSLNLGNTYICTELSFNSWKLLLSMGFLLAVTYIDYKYITSLAYSYGFSGGTNLMTYARNSLADGKSLPYSIYIPIVIAQMLAYLITHDFIKGIVNKCEVRRHNFLKLICIALYFVITILSSGRTMLMYYVLFILFDACVLMKVKSGWSTVNNRKIIKYGLISIIIILIAFTIIDTYLRSSLYGTQRTVWGQITKYSSSSLYALNNYLQSPTTAADSGYETLYNVYSVLNRFGFNFEIGHNYLEGTTFANVSTNIYTALRRYIHDYGYLGMLTIQFLIGFFYQYAYKNIKREKSSLFSLIMYGTFIYAPVFNCIEERVMINVLSLKSVMMLVFTYFLIMIFRNKSAVQQEQVFELE